MVTTDDVRGKFLHASFVESTETTEPFDVAAAVDAFELWLQSERARIWEECLDAYPQAAPYAPNPYEEN